MRLGADASTIAGLLFGMGPRTLNGLCRSDSKTFQRLPRTK